MPNYQNQTVSTTPAINAELEKIKVSIESKLDRAPIDGQPNQMTDTLDMDSERIINLPAPVSLTEPLRLQELKTFTLPVKLDGTPVFDNVAQMKLQNLSVGQRVSLTRYYADGPLIQNLNYIITTGTADGFVDHTIANGNLAQLVISESLSIEAAGADPTNINDSSPNINAAIVKYPKVTAGDGVFKCLSDINGVSRHSLTGCPSTEFRIAASGINLFNLFECLYFVVSDISIVFDVDNAVAIKLFSNGGTSTQLNKFYNINVEGAGRPGTISVFFQSVAFTNQFYSCNFFRTAFGIIFGEVGVAGNAVNANHFYGCEVRHNQADLDSKSPVIHRGGDNNGFIGGVIENWREAITVDGGSFFLNKVYLEGFNSATAMILNGGNLRLDGCFRSNSVFVNGGKELTIIDPDLMATPEWNENFPMIQYRADVNTRLTLISNSNVADTGFLHRAGQWRNSSGGWANRTSVNERVSWLPSIFNIRLSSDRENVTGDGETYTVNFGSNKEFDYNLETDNNGIFTAKQCGIWELKTNITLGGLEAGDIVKASIKTTGRDYYVIRQSLSANDFFTGGQYTITGTCLALMNVGNTARVTLQVIKATPATTIDVIRGNAVDAFTSFSGSIVRG